MGEMASSLAHEVNQPLAAIYNFSRGCLRRLTSGKSSASEFRPALEQISEQAEREMLKAAGFPDSEEYWQRLWDSAREMLAEMPTPGMRAEAEVLLELGR